MVYCHKIVFAQDFLRSSFVVSVCKPQTFMVYTINRIIGFTDMKHPDKRVIIILSYHKRYRKASWYVRVHVICYPRFGM